MEAVGYLADAQLRGAQQERGFHEEHLVDVVDNGAPRDLADDAREVDGADMKRGGVERDVVVLGEMVGQQTDEADEDLLDALGNLAVDDSVLLRVLQVEQEDSIEQAQHFGFIDVVGLQVTDDFAHLRGQVAGGVGRQRLFRLVQLHDGQVGDMHEVVERGCIYGSVLVGHQTEAAEVVGGGDDGNGKARRVGVEVVGMKCQLATVVANCHPPPFNQRKDVAGKETLLLVRAQGRYGIGFKAVHRSVSFICRVA